MNKGNKINLRKVGIGIAIYSALFLIIGPKFTIWNLMELHNKGESRHDAVHEFLGGIHQDGKLELCFQGIAHGQEGPISFATKETDLAEWEENSLGNIELQTKDLKSGCNELSDKNIKFDILRSRRDDKEPLHNQNQDQLNSLDKATYVLFLPGSTPGRLDPYSFVLYWKDNVGKENFYLIQPWGTTQFKVNATAYDYIKAFLTDYLTWPFFWLMILTGGGSH